MRASGEGREFEARFRTGPREAREVEARDVGHFKARPGPQPQVAAAGLRGKCAGEFGRALGGPDPIRLVGRGQRALRWVRGPGYDYSVAWSWLLRQDQNEYRSHPEYADRMAGFAPVAELAPWDQGYQNLWANDGAVLVHLSGYRSPNFGRGDRQGGNSRDSWLIEIPRSTSRWGDLIPARGRSPGTRLRQYLLMSQTGMVAFSRHPVIFP